MELVLNERCLSEIIGFVHSLTGITMAKSKSFMIEGRLKKRMRDLNVTSYESYLELAKTSKQEQVHFIDLITTNETYFYRTPRIWDYIEAKVLPTWYAQNPNSVFTVWSAAASSGEEAHTLGIVCQNFKEKNPNFIFQITGTDISNEMVQLCRDGVYKGRSVESLNKARPELFSKFMKESASGAFEVTKEIKSRLKFQQHNLFNTLALKEKFDLVLLRNVLIYFNAADQEKVISNVCKSTKENGIVIIGESESLTSLNTPLKPLEPLIYIND